MRWSMPFIRFALHGLADCQCQRLNVAKAGRYLKCLHAKGIRCRPSRETSWFDRRCLDGPRPLFGRACDEIDFVLHVKAAVTICPVLACGLSVRSRRYYGGCGVAVRSNSRFNRFQQQLEKGRPFAFIGKPCDVSAIRGLAKLTRVLTSL